MVNTTAVQALTGVLETSSSIRKIQVVLIISLLGIFGFIKKGIWVIRWPNGKRKGKRCREHLHRPPLPGFPNYQHNLVWWLVWWPLRSGGLLWTPASSSREMNQVRDAKRGLAWSLTQPCFSWFSHNLSLETYTSWPRRPPHFLLSCLLFFL